MENLMRSTDMTVAQEILRQLGFQGFIRMTGANHFVGGTDSLSFRLPGGGGFCKNGINYVRITLMPSDTYNVEFGRIRGNKYTIVATPTDIYFDGLLDCISSETGLAVRMPRVTLAQITKGHQ